MNTLRLGRCAQRGISLVELMIGIVIALLIAAAGASLLTTHLRENRALLLEARLMQDLRTAADLVTRDLRRAGHWGAAVDGVWAEGATGVSTNPYLAVTPSAAAADAVAFRYSRDAAENNAVDSNEQFGFRLRAGAIELQFGAGNWQALTDVGTFKVTEFSVTPTVQDVSLDAFCARPCPAGGGGGSGGGTSSTCPPHLQVRSFAVVIGAQLATDASVLRRVRSSVRLRNDAVTGSCA